MCGNCSTYIDLHNYWKKCFELRENTTIYISVTDFTELVWNPELTIKQTNSFINDCGLEKHGVLLLDETNKEEDAFWEQKKQLFTYLCKQLQTDEINEIGNRVPTETMNNLEKTDCKLIRVSFLQKKASAYEINSIR